MPMFLWAEFLLVAQILTPVSPSRVELDTWRESFTDKERHVLSSTSQNRNENELADTLVTHSEQHISAFSELDVPFLVGIDQNMIKSLSSLLSSEFENELLASCASTPVFLSPGQDVVKDRESETLYPKHRKLRLADILIKNSIKISEKGRNKRAATTFSQIPSPLFDKGNARSSGSVTSSVKETTDSLSGVNVNITTSLSEIRSNGKNESSSITTNYILVTDDARPSSSNNGYSKKFNVNTANNSADYISNLTTEYTTTTAGVFQTLGYTNGKTIDSSSKDVGITKTSVSTSTPTSINETIPTSTTIVHTVQNAKITNTTDTTPFKSTADYNTPQVTSSTHLSNLPRHTTVSTTDKPSLQTSNNKTTIPYKSCYLDMCYCPDYNTLADMLVPILRQNLGTQLAKFEDSVVRYVVIELLVTQGENTKSFLYQLLRSFMQSTDLNVLWTAIVLSNAMEGSTFCKIPSNNTFVLNSTAEAKLFPQVAYKNAFLTSTGKAPPDFTASGDLAPTQLYNISFECKEGARLLITKDSSLFRYGRWNDNCHVDTEGKLTMDRNMSLIDLTKTGGTTDWIFNITALYNTEEQLYQNFSNSNAISTSVIAIKNITDVPILNSNTIFPHVRNVRMWNTTISLQMLSDVLGLFQKATSLDIRNSSLGDFNCSQLLPSPASWTNFTLSNTSLKTLPACLLRPSLISLTLPHNDISDLTPLQYPRFVPATRMDILDLSDNEISNLGVLTDMNLTVLFLAGNKISTLSKLTFARLAKLSWLDLSRNQIRYLEPGSFKTLTWLMLLHLENNQLQRFDSSVRPLRTTLTDIPCKIYLHNNKFSHPPFSEDMYDPGLGMSVFASGNPYACDCDMQRYVESTANKSLAGSYADRNEMTCRLPVSLRGQPLDSLRFSAATCPVVIDCPQGCTCTLSRYGRDIKLPGSDNNAVPSTSDFNGLSPSQSGVVTANCSLVQNLQMPNVLPEKYALYAEFQGSLKMNETATPLIDSDYLLRIVSFNLSRRGLTVVPEFLCEALPKAQIVDLSFNKLTHLPDCFHTRDKTLPTLELRLAGNPWACGCDSVSMRSWLAEQMTRDYAVTEARAVDTKDATESEASGVTVTNFDKRTANASSVFNTDTATVSYTRDQTNHTAIKAGKEADSGTASTANDEGNQTTINDRKRVISTLGETGGVVVSDVGAVMCSASSPRAGKRVAEWDISDCELPDYLPWVLSLAALLGVGLVLGPLLYVYRLKAMVAIHATLHVRPFTHVHRFEEEDYDHEALIVHGASQPNVRWVLDQFLSRTQRTRHRVCIPERDFLPGASTAESYANAVARSKAVLCLLSKDVLRDEWWLYGFQLARAKHARSPHAKLLLVWMEGVQEAVKEGGGEDNEMPEEVTTFLKTNTYLSAEDSWFWKKLFFYLPDPPKNIA